MQANVKVSYILLYVLSLLIMLKYSKQPLEKNVNKHRIATKKTDTLRSYNADERNEGAHRTGEVGEEPGNLTLDLSCVY